MGFRMNVTGGAEQIALDEKSIKNINMGNFTKYMEQYFRFSFNGKVVGQTKEKVIFAFEGLGSNYGVTNKYRIKNQYNVVFVYCENGQIVYACDKYSTLPDTTLNATLKDGVYAANYHNHKKSYVSLQLVTDKQLIINDKDLKELQDNNNKEITYGQENVDNIYVPAYRFRPHQTNKAIKAGTDGIDLHTGKNITDTTMWSIGCSTVAEDEYYEFGVTSGFIDVQKDPENYTKYEDFKGKLRTNYEGQHWGYVVVNRKYMNQTDRETFLPDDEKNN